MKRTNEEKTIDKRIIKRKKRSRTNLERSKYVSKVGKRAIASGERGSLF